MTVTAQLAPFTRPNVTALLQTSAKAAAAQCNGGPSKSACGIQWDKNGTWDGTEGVGQSMSALETVIGALVSADAKIPPPVTGSTGGTSVSVPKAGKNRTATYVDTSVITTADKGGAWFLTVLILFIGSVSIWFMWSENSEWTRGGKLGPTIAGKLGYREKAPESIKLGHRKSMGSLGGMLEEGNRSPAPMSGNPKNVPAHRGGTLIT